VKILILGGTRFIGKALAKSLSVNKSYIVDVLSKRKSKLKKINKQYLGNLKNNFIKSTSDYDLIIDFISKEKKHIDNVLKNFNFNKYDVVIFTIEHNFIETKRNNVLQLMSANNYVRVFQKISQWDDWYIKKNNTILKCFALDE